MFNPVIHPLKNKKPRLSFWHMSNDIINMWPWVHGFNVWKWQDDDHEGTVSSNLFG